MAGELRVAYQGEPGAYTEQASIEFFARARADATYVPCQAFADVVRAVDAGRAERALLPIENSLAGTIHSNLDLLLAYPGLHIVGEHDLRVRHCLVALPGTRVEDVRVVRSHFMAIAQCTGFLGARALVSEVAADTAGSAARIRREELAGCAAIASRRAAELYGLDVLAESIEDEKENYTRFLVLARKEVPALRPLALPAKTSIVFTLHNKPGALFRALSVFSVLDIDLTKIESRHVHTVVNTVQVERKEALRWGYVFYVDFARNFDELPVQNALSNLQQITPFYRLIGSYTRHFLAGEHANAVGGDGVAKTLPAASSGGERARASEEAVPASEKNSGYGIQTASREVAPAVSPVRAES